MKIEGLHEKEIFNEKFPFRMLVNRNINFVYPPHWHNAIELIYVLENSFVVLVNSKRYELKEKDIMYIPSGDVHEFCSETPTGKRLFINFEFSNLSYFADVEDIFMQLRDVRLITPNDGEIHQSIAMELQKILDAQQTCGAARELYYTSRIIDILVLLSQSSPSLVHMGNLRDKGEKRVGLEKIEKSLAYIENKYMENIHLGDIARAAGFSEYYFSRLFKEITEKSFHQYLNKYRIKKAEELLSDKNYTVSEAAYAVGFSSIATFDRIFHQVKGCSPKEFRKLHRT